MGTLAHTILIRAAPARVFDLLTDPSRFPLWRGGVLAVEAAPRPLRTGDAYAATMRALPLGPTTRCRFEMACVERPTVLVQHGRTPVAATISTDRLRPVAGGTELAFTLEYTLRPGRRWRLAAALLLRPLLAMTLRRSLLRLKRLAETA